MRRIGASPEEQRRSRTTYTRVTDQCESVFLESISRRTGCVANCFRCGPVLLQTGFGANWLCCGLAVLRSGCVAVWLCCGLVVLRSGCVAVWLCCGLIVLRTDCVADWLCQSLFLLRTGCVKPRAQRAAMKPPRSRFEPIDSLPLTAKQ